MSGITKAVLQPEKGSEIKCMFNPVSLKIEKKNSWDPLDAPRKDAPGVNFLGGSSGTLDVDLTLDTTDTGKPVTDYTDQILELMKVGSFPKDSKNTREKVPRPPWVRFRWGKTSSFKAVVTSASITFTYFSSDGKPLRATASIKMMQFEDEGKWPLQNPTSETPELHTVHTIRTGETLDRIAYQHYGDSTLWKEIARKNRILDPLELAAGTRLQIPDREVVAGVE